jgi:2-polyprenyl-3-methyl-5-hydroxy-6-metoxy-1,4-benzoquinol methylase
MAPVKPTACPLCREHDFEIFTNRGRDGRPLATTICRRCGFVWVNPPPADNDLRRYYAWTYRQEAKGTARRTLRQVYRAAQGAAARYEVLKPHLRPGAAVLDVGSGGGELVYLLRKVGVEAIGVEPDQTYSAFAREELAVPVETAFLQDVRFPDRSFDMVLLYHVLEHVPRPADVIAVLRPWLKHAGALVVEVPNLESRCEAPISRFHHDHLSYFTRRTLSAFAADAGLAPVSVELSTDGGNILLIARAGADAAPVDLGREFQQVRGLFGARAALDFYLSRLPYARMLSRARRYVQSSLASRRFSRAAEILDAQAATLDAASTLPTLARP